MGDSLEQNTQPSEEDIFFLASIVESSQDSIITINFDGNITSWNKAAEWLYGYPASETIGKPLTMLTLPEDLQEVLSNVNKIKHSERVEIFDSIRLNKDGRRMNLEVVLSPVKNAAGRVVGVSTVARDITERKQAEESTRFQAHLLDTVEQAVIATDLDGIVLHWNQFAQKLYGWTAREAMGRQIMELIMPEMMAAQALEILSQLRQGRSWAGEFNVQRRDGTTFPAQLINSPISDAEGGLIGIVGVSVDISERKRAEAALRDAQERLLQAMDAAKMFSWEMKPETQEFSYSSNVERTIGFTFPEDIINNPAGNRLHPEDAERAVRKTLRALETGGPYEDTMRMVNPHTGEIVWMHSQGILATNAEGEQRFVGIAQNITERKRQEDSLIEITRQLERQSNVFNTTLSSITDFAYTFDRDGRFIYANQPLLDLWGLKLDEAVGKNFFDLQYPDDLASRLQQQIRQVFDTGQALRDETPYTSPTGAEGFYEYIFTPVFASDGTVEVVAGSTRDYTERRRVETALRESRERLQMAMNAAKIYSWEMNLATQQIEWSNNLERVIGFHLPSNFPAVISLVHPEDREETAELIARAISGGEDYESEFRLVNPQSGENVWVRGQGVLVGDAQNSPQRFVGITQNITERKHAEILLDTQKRALEMVVGGSPLAEVLKYLIGIVEHQSSGSSVASIMLLDEQGRLHTGASPGLPEDYVRAIEGIEADESVGTCSAAAATCKTIISPDIAADPKWQDLKHLPLGLGLQAAWSLPIVAADERVLGTFGTYFREKRGPTKLERQTVEILARTAALAIERKQAEEALRGSEAKLQKSHEELERRVGERTAALSEMNAVLQEEVGERRRIEGERVELLRRIVFAQEDERRRIAREMHDQFGQQLTVLKLKLDAVKEVCGEREGLCEQVDALQTIARQLDADVDHMVWELHPTALDDLGLQTALSSYVRSWSKHFGVPVELHASGMDKDRLSPESETALYRIAQEALNNVAKHAEAKSVAIVLERRAAQVSLIIEDDGAGFDLQRVLGADHKGLGLIGMRERAALVGGTVEIESQPNEGATVVVRLPVPPAPQTGEGDE